MVGSKTVLPECGSYQSAAREVAAAVGISVSLHGVARACRNDAPRSRENRSFKSRHVVRFFTAFIAIWKKIVSLFRYNLGKVLESLGEYETASDAMDTALTIEITSPILPFNSVPLVFD